MLTSMGVIIPVFLWLTLSVPTLCYHDHQIYVDSQTGINDSSCWEGGYSTPCFSLNLALKGVQHYNHSTAVLLQPGQHHLCNGSETQLWNVSKLAIVGNGSEGEVVVIRCGPLAGLAFFWSEDINLTNVILIGCGAVQNSTSRNTNASTVEFLYINVGIYFCDCKDITLTHVQIEESTGTGVVLYNAMGVVNIVGCNISCNGQSVEQDGLYGGGGLITEANKVSSQLFIIVTNSTFINNSASGEFSLNKNPSGYFGLGRGGGLSVVFRGWAVNNTVLLSGVNIIHNRAQFGGGVFLAFYGNASNNTVNIDKCEVMENEATLSRSTISKSNIGGGVFLTFVATERSWPFNNKVGIINSIFTSNEAETGGGIAVSTSIDSQHRCFDTNNELLIDKCAFDNNEAFQGASAYFSQDSCRCQPLVETTVCSSNFTNGLCGEVEKWVCKVGMLKSGFALPCSGNMLLQTFSLVIQGTTIFTANQLSALKLRSSSIKLLPSAELQFINNTALRGAALHLVDCSSVIVTSSSALLFLKNTATDQGDAIYAEDCNVVQTGSRQCFIRHTNSSLHPDDWETTFNFSAIEHLFSSSSSIYVDSIRSCIWPDSDSPDSNNHNRTFCWRGWFYKDSLGNDEGCLNQLKSGPAYVNTNCSPNYTLYPGETVNVQVTVYDDWDRDITYETDLNVRITTGPAYISDNGRKSITLSPSDLHNITLLADCSNGYSDNSFLLSVSIPQFPAAITKVFFNSCEKATSWGTYCNTDSGKCEIPIGYLNNELCLSIDLATNSLCYGPCPLSYKTTYMYNNSQLRFRDLTNDLVNNLTCAPHRVGRLCGRCADGYGVAINDPDFICTKCKPYGFAFYLFLELFPVVIMIIIITVLHINITDGFLNGFVLYSQLLTLHSPGLGYSALLPNLGIRFDGVHYSGIPLTVYSIWNLNFLTLYPVPFCLPIADTAAKAIALQYLIAACPLLFIVLTYTWIQLYSRGYRSVVYITRPVHQVLARFWQKFKIHPSLIDSYAGLILLSYMRFIDASVKLLQPTGVDYGWKIKTAFYYDANLDYFSGPHAAYGVLAIVCLLVFVVPPLTVLLFYHLMIFQRCLSWCKLDRPGLHALVDAYQGCFRNSATDAVERRYFVGIYLLIRVLVAIWNIFDIFTFLVCGAGFSLLLAGMVVLLQPYKKTAHNVIDFLILFLLSVMTAASLSGYDIGVYFSVSIAYLPFLVLCSYLTYRLLKYSCGIVIKCMRNKAAQTTTDNVAVSEQSPLLPPVSNSEVSVADFAADDVYADRILNPSAYK